MTFANNSRSSIHLLVPMADIPVNETMSLEIVSDLAEGYVWHDEQGLCRILRDEIILGWQRHQGPDSLMGAGPPLLEGGDHGYD